MVEEAQCTVLAQVRRCQASEDGRKASGRAVSSAESFDQLSPVVMPADCTIANMASSCLEAYTIDYAVIDLGVPLVAISVELLAKLVGRSVVEED